MGELLGEGIEEWDSGECELLREEQWRRFSLCLEPVLGEMEQRKWREAGQCTREREKCSARACLTQW